MSLPHSCRRCDQIDLNPRYGVYNIPSKNLWFQLSDYVVANRALDPASVLYYCPPCYIRVSLEGKGERCLHCGVFSVRGLPHSLHSILGNRVDSHRINGCSHHFTCPPDQIPSHLQRNGSLCELCVEHLITTGLLAKDEKQSGRFEYHISHTCALCQRQWDNDNKDDFPEGEVIMAWTRFTSPTECSYGLSGSFVISPPITATVYPCQVCNICLKDRQMIPALTVKCDFCNQRYQPSISEKEFPEMGFGCCGRVSEEGVDCGWGSRYDDNLYGWVTVMPAVGNSLRPQGRGELPTLRLDLESSHQVPAVGKKTMCDNCIDCHIAEGTLRLVAER